MKKILVVDDSALMRRVFCDIINSDKRFMVADEAINGADALELLQKNTYDVVVLDVNMPRMDGITLLRTLKEQEIAVRILMASTLTRDGAKVTLEALELGALDFIHKPDWAYRCREDDFKKSLLDAIDAVSRAHLIVPRKKKATDKYAGTIEKIVAKQSLKITGKRIVAIACSTGGPKALQSVLPLLPENLKAPVVVVQHMPAGFTSPFAHRLDQLCRISVTEAQEGEALRDGCVYIAKSGQHMHLMKKGGVVVVHYTDEPPREGVKPCANYMYESLAECDYDEALCVVMTGMGADGTAGISSLKKSRKAYVIAQDAETCVVNGMPGNVVKAGLSDQSVPLSLIAQEIILHVGVK